MARFITRTADLCRHRAAEERFLRRFSMSADADAASGDAGPGWYESSRDLEAGLQVRESAGDALLAEWHEACRRFVAPTPSARTAA
jgi:hypothetical protein